MEKAQHTMILLYDYHNKQHILLYLVVLNENILLYTTTAMLYKPLVQELYKGSAV